MGRMRIAVWLDEMRAALDLERDADVPCGSCTACCTSSQFVHIDADETDALAHIPPQLLFPAPRAPRGTMLLGYDDEGRCPMLGEHGCSIYEHRPRTCRTYDCRVFAATGIEPDSTQPAIAERVRQWVFESVDERDAAARDALAAAAAFTRGRTNPTEHAVAAVRRAVEALSSTPRPDEAAE